MASHSISALFFLLGVVITGVVTYVVNNKTNRQAERRKLDQKLNQVDKAKLSEFRALVHQIECNLGRGEDDELKLNARKFLTILDRHQYDDALEISTDPLDRRDRDLKLFVDIAKLQLSTHLRICEDNLGFDRFSCLYLKTSIGALSTALGRRHRR